MTTIDNVSPETTHFGLTRVTSGEAWSKNGWAFSDLDRTKLDQLLFAALTHTHDGEPALGDPTDPPTLVANQTGGTLPAATSYYYRCSFVDENGLESAASTEASVTTPDPMDPPTAPSTTVDNSAGTLAPGIYSYLITYLDNFGGETTPSALASAQITGDPNTAGGGTNQVRLDLPAMPTGVASINIYRSRPGQSNFYFLGSATTTPYFDTGDVEDQTVTVPTLNNTSGTNSVDITIPGGFIPEGCHSWRIYRATQSGAYDGNSLVHEVTEGTTDTATTPLLVWTDDGDAMQAGFPQNSSSTVPHGSLLTLNQVDGTLPLSAMARGSQTICAYCPDLSVGGTFMVTDSPGPVGPVRLTAYLITPATTGPATFTVTDSAGTSVSTTITSGNYAETVWPVVTNEVFEAEDGTFSGTDVVIDNDDAALSGQAVVIGSVNDSVNVELGVLDKGVYDFFATVRVTTFGTITSANDLQIGVFTDAGTLIAQAGYTPAAVASPPAPLEYAYVEYAGPQIVMDGVTSAYMQVMKTDAGNTTAYDVDSMRFAANTVQFVPGTLTFSVSGTTDGNYANVALWF